MPTVGRLVPGVIPTWPRRPPLAVVARTRTLCDFGQTLVVATSQRGMMFTAFRNTSEPAHRKLEQESKREDDKMQGRI